MKQTLNVTELNTIIYQINLIIIELKKASIILKNTETINFVKQHQAIINLEYAEDTLNKVTQLLNTIKHQQHGNTNTSA